MSQRYLRQLVAVILSAIGAGFLPGCGSKDEGSAKGGAGVKTEGIGQKGADSSASISSKMAQLEPRLHQSMKEAVTFEPPENQLRPPDETFAKKSAGKLFDAIVGKDGVGGLWDKVVFVNEEGKRLRYTAQVRTDQGDIHLELWPEAAPNHVRNFVALARAGYFDGLPFHRAASQKLDGKSLTYLEAGCPKGTGEIGFGSIGYWLKPELSDKVHEEGVLGAWHDEVLESAACRFYITLGPAPWMDRNYTIFGKVVEGLAVAQKIHKRPGMEEDPDRPREPVLIRGVVIQVQQDEVIAARAN